MVLVSSINANFFLAACYVLELNGTVNKSEKSIVSADTNICAGMNLCSALSNK